MIRDSAYLYFWFGFVIRDSGNAIYDSDSWFVIRLTCKFDSDSWFDEQTNIKMIRICDSVSVLLFFWFGFVIRRIIPNHESYDSRIIWFAHLWFRQNYFTFFTFTFTFTFSNTFYVFVNVKLFHVILRFLRLRSRLRSFFILRFFLRFLFYVFSYLNAT